MTVLPIKQVYDYLVNTAACDQTRENVNEFLEKCKRHDLAKAEVLNILNIRPTAAVEIFPVSYLSSAISLSCSHNFCVIVLNLSL